MPGSRVSSVLVVDDEPSVLKALGTLFGRAGYAVHAAANGAEGIAQWERHQPDVTVLDLVLPDMSGLEVLKRLRTRGAVVIMLTGHAEVETAVSAMELGAETFLTKPPDTSHLMAAVERAAEHADIRRRHRQLEETVRGMKGRRRWMVLALVGLVVAALVLGYSVGGWGADDARPRAPVPVPIDSVP